MSKAKKLTTKQKYDLLYEAWRAQSQELRRIENRVNLAQCRAKSVYRALQDKTLTEELLKAFYEGDES